MTIDRNDPRWTAYVLDELEAFDRASFEKEIEAFPEAEEILDEIRKTVGLLETSLKPAPIQLTDEQRDRVDNAIPSTRTVSYTRLAFVSGIAALVLAGFVTLSIPSLLRSRSAAPVSGTPLVAEAMQTSGQSAQSTFSGPEEAIREADAVRDAQTDATAPSPAQSPESETNTLIAENTVQTDSSAQIAQGTEVQGGTSGGVAAVFGGTIATPVVVTVEADQLLPSTAASVGVAQPLVATRAFSFGAAGAAPPPPPPAAGPARLPPGGGGQVIGQIAENVLDSLVVLIDRPERERFNTEEYGLINDNPFYLVSQEPLATFSVDVDTASYANVRRFLTQRMLPPPDAVRIEEMINYFTYDYESPSDGRPVRVSAQVASAPWNPEHRLVRIGIQGQRIERNERAASNLVFLIDVSGSMSSADKLPLLKNGMKLLVEQLGENDRVAIVVYAGASGLALESTPGDQTERLIRALDRLSAGGSTNGGEGIELAYETAVANFIEGGVNRVILATDGDFNIGVTNNGALTRLIEEKAETGVFLSVLGFGTGNLNDAGLESLADHGNGNYAYIDTIREARKVLVEEMGSTLVTIAKDVKFQIEFNPAEVNAYRLIGYENRVLENQDFNDDTKDAGEIGAGHAVTALFEVVPNGVDLDVPGVDPLRYQTTLQATDQAGGGELLTVKVRYKEPDEDVSLLIETPVRDNDREFSSADADYRFASAVAAFGMILRDSPYKGDASLDTVLEIAEASLGADSEGYREEFVDLVRRARAIRDLN